MIAERTGMSIPSVAKVRNTLGILSLYARISTRKYRKKTCPAEIENILGKKPDQEVSQIAGVSLSTAILWRRSRGIPTCERYRRELMRRRLTILHKKKGDKLNIKQVAQLFGVDVSTVRKRSYEAHLRWKVVWRPPQNKTGMRNMAIAVLHDAGFQYPEIGKLFGISPQHAKTVGRKTKKAYKERVAIE